VRNELQQWHVRQVFYYTKGRVSGLDVAAEILGMKRTSLYSHMKALGILKQNLLTKSHYKQQFPCMENIDYIPFVTVSL